MKIEKPKYDSGCPRCGGLIYHDRDSSALACLMCARRYYLFKPKGISNNFANRTYGHACEVCGTGFTDHTPVTKYCAECRAKRRRAV